MHYGANEYELILFELRELLMSHATLGAQGEPREPSRESKTRWESVDEGGHIISYIYIYIYHSILFCILERALVCDRDHAFFVFRSIYRKYLYIYIYIYIFIRIYIYILINTGLGHLGWDMGPYGAPGRGERNPRAEWA